LTKVFCEDARKNGAKATFEGLSEEDRTLVDEFLQNTDTRPASPTLLVRSNAASEDLQARGTFGHCAPRGRGRRAGHAARRGRSALEKQPGAPAR
jgi:hypothetical protein